MSIPSLFAQDGAIQEKIVQAVREYYTKILNDRVENFEIKVQRIPHLRFDIGEIISVRGEDSSAVPRGSRLCWVDIRSGGEERSCPVTLKAVTFERVPTAVQDIPPRTDLNEQLILWKTVETTNLGAALIPKPEEIMDYWAKTNIPAGTIITGSRLRLRPDVMLGKEVAIISRIGAVEAKVQGEALEDGRIGESIRVSNGISGKCLKGMVEAPGVVVVK